METTKLIVEYLVVGILVCLAISFLVFALSPINIQSSWLLIVQDASLIVVIILLPISYGVGLVAEYLGMVLYEKYFDAVKEKRFPAFIRGNKDLLTESALLAKYAQTKDQIPRDAGKKMYGEMRFFTLMKNAPLYAEIESHVNQARILRTLTIAEILFLVGVIIQLVRTGFSLLPFIVLFFLVFLLVFNILAILHRFNRYCRAIERSYKVIMLDELNNPVRK
jgi:hypothetical protein